MTAALTTLGAIGWQPEIRGALIIITAVAILCGSIYLIVATNTGSRLGFLIAFTGLAGWILIMGVVWMIYGIGLKGKEPSWEVREALVGDISQAETTRARDLDGWRKLPEGDKARGDAQATADALLQETGEKERLLGDAEATYVTVGALDIGGKQRIDKEPCSPFLPSKWPDTFGDCWDRVVHRVKTIAELKHPTHYAIIQVQRAKEVEVEPGAAPPTPEADPSEPVVSVVMVRDLGNRRFPPAMVTLTAGVLFSLGAVQLHRRDKAAMAAQAAVSPA